VFVTTHFLEEVDYCDWVAFIDAGRLVADAAPEDLRRRYSTGYRIAVDVGPEARGAAAAALGPAAVATPAGLALQVPALEPDVLAALARVAAEHPAARVHIEQPEMTEVFRRVLADAGART
jgi:ABC-2 type transport system ATP-binding protein